MLPRVLAATLVVTGALAGAGIAGGRADGPQRLLVILATWGPEPFSSATVEQVAAETSRFVADSSFGKVSLTTSVTPWQQAFATRPATCAGTRSIAQQSEGAAARAGYATTRYDRVVYLLPRLPCSFAGHAQGKEIWLVGELDAGLLAHELGHTWGLGHANRWDCGRAKCRLVEYGDRFSVMGILGRGQFGAYEKYRLGWLTDADVVRPTTDGTYTIDQLEEPSDLPQALVITTARREYWLDHREPLLEDAWLEHEPATDGVFVHAAASSSGQFGLVPNPARTGVDAFLPGDRFSVPGSFELTVLRHVGTHVEVDFRWTREAVGARRLSAGQDPELSDRNTPATTSPRTR